MIVYLGCTLGSPPGVPGGGMTFSCPPPGGATRISESTPAGGQITPFESASLSLRLVELAPPDGRWRWDTRRKSHFGLRRRLVSAGLRRGGHGPRNTCQQCDADRAMQ